MKFRLVVATAVALPLFSLTAPAAHAASAPCTYDGPAVCAGNVLNPNGGTSAADQAATRAIEMAGYFSYLQFEVSWKHKHVDPKVTVINPSPSALLQGYNRAAWHVTATRLPGGIMVTVGLVGNYAGEISFGYINGTTTEQEGLWSSHFLLTDSRVVQRGDFRIDNGALPDLHFTGNSGYAQLAYGDLVAAGI